MPLLLHMNHTDVECSLLNMKKNRHINIAENHESHNYSLETIIMSESKCKNNLPEQC